MAVKINVAQATRSGITIPAGAIACFTIAFPAVALRMSMNFAIYKDLATVQAGGVPIQDVGGISLFFEKTYNIDDYARLTQAQIEIEAKDFIEKYVGAGNCETVTKDLLQPPVE